MEFEVKLRKIDRVYNHPNADRLDIAMIGGYEVVVGRDQHVAGEKILYIPEAAILPDWIIAKLGLEGRLAGRHKNRVKAIRLRNVLSQGLLMSIVEEHDEWIVNELDETRLKADFQTNYADFLGIQKYEPPIPIEMSGQVMNAPFNLPSYDVENWKKDPEVIATGDDVLGTEKLHGTLTCVAWNKDDPENYYVASKGLAHRNQCFVTGDEGKTILYRRTVDPIAERLQEQGFKICPQAQYISWIGETIGKRIQDLNYGQQSVLFVPFELAYKEDDKQEWKYVDDAVMRAAATAANVRPVPIVGTIRIDPPVTRELVQKVQDFSKGPTLFGGNHMREGVVLRHPSGVVRKVVSDTYLTRRKGTERT